MEINEDHITNSHTKVEVPRMNSPTSATGITRQGSNAKTNNCLCSPTTHAGSFRCRLHRVPPALQRTKSIDSRSLKDSRSKANMSAAETTNTGNTVEAQQQFVILMDDVVVVALLNLFLYYYQFVFTVSRCLDITWYQSYTAPPNRVARENE